MSALGQKRTCAAQNGMFALTPKADMCGATRHVRFVPIADMPIGNHRGFLGAFTKCLSSTHTGA
jgi:hypothetical protein